MFEHNKFHLQTEHSKLHLQTEHNMLHLQTEYNQKPSIKEGETIQWPNEKGAKCQTTIYTILTNVIFC
jgi:hypothetical protein